MLSYVGFGVVDTWSMC